MTSKSTASSVGTDSLRVRYTELQQLRKQVEQYENRELLGVARSMALSQAKVKVK